MAETGESLSGCRQHLVSLSDEDMVGHTAWDSSIVWGDGGPKPR
jgi:hypothetical protein